ncbi:MAG: hypothetical protein WAN93_06275 [Solirubrobacteraceae bacterium]
MASNDTTNGQHAREAQEAERRKREADERELAQNTKIAAATVAFGNAVEVDIPQGYQPLGPTQGEIKSRAFVQKAIKFRDENDKSLPTLYLGSKGK